MYTSRKDEGEYEDELARGAVERVLLLKPERRKLLVEVSGGKRMLGLVKEGLKSASDVDVRTASGTVSRVLVRVGGETVGESVLHVSRVRVVLFWDTNWTIRRYVDWVTEKIKLATKGTPLFARLVAGRDALQSALSVLAEATDLDTVEDLNSLKAKCQDSKRLLESSAVAMEMTDKEMRGVLVRGIRKATGAVEGTVRAIDKALNELAESAERRAYGLIRPLSLAMAYSIKTGWIWADAEALQSKAFMRWADHEARSALNAPVVATATARVTKTGPTSGPFDLRLMGSTFKTALSAMLPSEYDIRQLSVTWWAVGAPDVSVKSRYAPSPPDSACVAMYAVKLTHNSAHINLDVTCIEIVSLMDTRVHIHTFAPSSGYYKKKLLDPDEPWDAVRSLIGGPPSTVSYSARILPISLRKSSVLKTVAATLGFFVSRARDVVATANDTANGGVVSFGSPTQEVSAENNKTRLKDWLPDKYSTIMQDEVWTSSYGICETAQYMPALLSLEWGIRELVELERVLDSAIGLLYSNFPDVPRSDAPQSNAILHLNSKTAEVCRVLRTVSTGDVVNQAADAVDALRSEISFQSMHYRANWVYTVLFKILLEACILELEVNNNHRIVKKRYGEDVANAVVGMEVPNFDVLNDAYAKSMSAAGVSNALEDGLFNICRELHLLSEVNTSFPTLDLLTTQPLLDFIKTTRAAARMLDSTHSVRLIRALDNMAPTLTNSDSFQKWLPEFRKLYIGLAFARGGVAPITTRMSALINMVALLQVQSFETHDTPTHFTLFLQLGGKAPVELARKTKAMSGIYTGLYDPANLRNPW